MASSRDCAPLRSWADSKTILAPSPATLPADMMRITESFGTKPIFTADETEDYLYRFIDTTSRIDIRTFKGAFSSSLNSVESITFDLNIYESDSQNRTMAFSSNYYL